MMLNIGVTGIVSLLKVLQVSKLLDCNPGEFVDNKVITNYGKEKYSMKKRWACLSWMVSVAVITSLAGCAAKKETAQEASAAGKTELKIMLRSDKPTGWDDVELEVEKRLEADGIPVDLNINWVSAPDYKEKLNLAITGGEQWDLVFDATFVYLKSLAAEGYYADLSPYWNNDEYPGLKKCFPEKMIEHNQFFGQKCVIPLLRTYGTGIQAVHYRQDWADEWGIGNIESYDQLVSYWDACLKNNPGVYPLGVTGSRGFYQLGTVGGLAENGIQMIGNSEINYYVYVKDNQVQAIAPEGSGDEAFKDFPAPFNRDFGMDRYETFSEWRNAGYIETDSLNQNDANTGFYSGLSASVIGTLDDVEKNLVQMSVYSPDAVIGEFLYNDRVRNMEDGAMETGYLGNNFLCVPANSKNIDLTMKYLNWIFEKEENHDLIELGIEGRDWSDNGDGTYKALSQYSFPGYMMTWTAEYVKFGDTIPEDILKYRRFELQDSAFRSNVLPGFTFDTSKFATETAQVKGITDKIKSVKLHGILSDGTTTYNSAAEMLKANLKDAYQSGGQVLEDALKEQVNTYLSEK